MNLLPLPTCRALFLGALAVLAAGCPQTPEPPAVQDDGGLPDAGEVEAPDGGGEPDGCIAITLGQQDFQANLFDQLTGVRYAVTPNLDGDAPESLLVEFYDSTTPDLPPLKTGTFPLGTPPNDSLLTCQHCVWLPVDWDGLSPLSKVFIATEGNVTLAQVEDPLTAIFAGGVSGLVLREANVSEEGEVTPIQDGRCLKVGTFGFDTSPTTGRPCLSAEDCGNPMLEVCSPMTNRCAPHECVDGEGCPGDRPICVTQYGSQTGGACYAFCDPTANLPCGNGRSCMQLGVNPQDGLCLLDGEATLGGACEREDTSTSCQAGMTCSVLTATCTRTCAFFTEAPGCQTGHACNVLGVCDPLSAGDDATFGETCAATAELAQGCASDGVAFRGICFSYEPFGPFVCDRACLGETDCGEDEFCAHRFSSGLGICLPLPVCGDGVLGEINEICDDGNTRSGDGCSADCQTVEYGPICTGAPLLQTGATSGDNTSGWDGFKSTCQLGFARSDVYRFSPTTRGRLRLTLDSQTMHAVSIRTTCANALSELACSSISPGDGSDVVHQIVDPDEVTVLVAGFTLLDHGPYTLTTEFTPELCGDGIVAGLETCDDGNTRSNDGCSGDCNTIEYAWFCGQAPALVPGLPSTGDNTGAVSTFETSCTGSVLGSGSDRLFTFTATSAGTARFRLEPDPQGVADLVLAVFDGCGDPATMTELGCSSVTDIEVVDVPVTQGQTLTVLVEGFHPHSTSAFTLSVEMVP